MSIACWKKTIQFTPLWLLLLAMVILRLPTLNRPLSKHHEFNTAVILINAQSWNEAGGGAKFSYTPLMNFQGEENKLLEKGWHIDSAGNHVYLSFGAGWYILPYWFFSVLKIAPSPLALQVLNMLIGLFTCIMLFAFLQKTGNSKWTALLFTTLFVLLPAPLWYMGNGYVTTAIMLPLVIAFCWCWKMFAEKPATINWRYVLVFALVSLLLTFIDWVAVFLLAAMAVWSISQAKRSTNYFWLAAIAVFLAALSVTAVLAQFANYLGWHQVLGYWKSRFTDRSMQSDDTGIAGLVIGCLKNLITGYLALIGAAVILLIKRRKFIPQIPSWQWAAAGAILVYNGLFLNWSAHHEFAWMAMALILTIMASTVMTNQMITTGFKWLFSAAMMASLGIYFYINKPGATSYKGERYDALQQLGKSIKNAVPSNAIILTNLDNEKIVEYYAGRTFNHAESKQQAIEIMIEHPHQKAVWMLVNGGKITAIENISAKQ